MPSRLATDGRESSAKEKSIKHQACAASEWPLYERPGFLIRRMHQIHVNLFNTFCGDIGVTPLQYSVMSALYKNGPADQTTLAGLVLLDRITTTDIIKRLTARNLIRRKTAERDRRSQLCSLTEQGAETVERIEIFAKSAHAETLLPLSEAEQATFIRLMKKIVSARDRTSEIQRLQSLPRVKRLDTL